MTHDNRIRIDLETALLLSETTFSNKDYEDWYHHIYTRRWRVRDDAYRKYGDLSDDGFYELTENGGGELKWEEIYTNDWAVSNDHYPMDDEEFLYCPTIYDVKTYLRKEHKLQITVYSKSQESWQYRITIPHQELSDGIFNEDFNEYEDALKDALKIALKQVIHGKEYNEMFREIKKIPQHENIPYVHDFICPVCGKTGDGFHHVIGEGYKELPKAKLIGYCESRLNGTFMMVFECPNCFGKFKYHNTTTARHNWENFKEELWLVWTLQKNK